MRAGEELLAVGSTRTAFERERVEALRGLDRQLADGEVLVDEYRMRRAALRAARTQAELRGAAGPFDGAQEGRRGAPGDAPRPAGRLRAALEKTFSRSFRRGR